MVTAPLVIKPVRAIDFAMLSFGSAVTGRAEIVVTDIGGAILKPSKIQVTSGTNAVRIDLSNFKKGVYVLKDRCGTFTN